MTTTTITSSAHATEATAPTKPRATRAKKTPVAAPSNVMPDGSNNLRLQFSARLRLDSDQRKLILNAWDEKNRELCGGHISRTGDIFATTNTNSPTLFQDLGMDRFTLASIIGGRESLPIGLIKRFERVLGVTLIDQDFMRACFETYLQHIATADL